MRRFVSPFFAAVTGAVVTAIVVGGVAIAQTSTPAVITACVAGGSGQVRIVSSASDCKANETTTAWNQQGPQGLPGTDGADGVSGWTKVASGISYVAPYYGGSQVAHCPTGTKVLGGGFRTDAQTGLAAGTTLGLTITWSAPWYDDQWLVEAVNETGQTLWLEAWAICAKVS